MTEATEKTWFFELGAFDGTSGYPREAGLFSSAADFDAFLLQRNNNGVVRSLFEYDDRDLEKANRRGPLAFDFDAEDDLERAREECLAVVDALVAGLGLYTSQIQISFSGGKGFHVTVPFEVFNTPPRPDLFLVYRSMFESLKKALCLQTADSSIYDGRRLWRVLNSQHPKSGLFKVPLTYEELRGKTAEEIRELAKAPRQVEYTPIVGRITAAEEKFARYSRLVEGKLKNPPAGVFNIRELPHYVREVVNGVSVGGRNNACFKLAYYYHRLAFRKEKALEKLLAWNSLNKPPLPDGEVKTVVESAYRYDVDALEKEEIVSTCFFEADGKTYQQVNGARFCCWDGHEYSTVDSFAADGVTYVPHGGPELPYVILAEKPEAYGSIDELVTSIEKLSTKYVDITPEFRKLSAYFVILTWVYDRFNTVPYWRVLGDTGGGKSRAKDTFGLMTYNYISASGATSVAPVFRLISKWGGTMGFDEADLRKSDATDELTKIFNCGFERGRPVLRCNPNNPEDVEAFDPFCPKMFGMRLPFEDPATESRCLSEEMQETTLNLPVELPDEFYTEATHIRNKLLDYRMRVRGTLAPATEKDLPTKVEPRLKQLALPMLSVMTETKDRESFFSFLRAYHEKLLEARANSTSGQVLEHLVALSAEITDGIPAKRIQQAMGLRDSRIVTRELRALGFASEPRRIEVLVEETVEEEGGKERKKAVPRSRTARCICCSEGVWSRLGRRYPFEALQTAMPSVLRPASKKLAAFGDKENES